jgi:hypothetical protein
VCATPRSPVTRMRPPVGTPTDDWTHGSRHRPVESPRPHAMSRDDSRRRELLRDVISSGPWRGRGRSATALSDRTQRLPPCRR